MHENKFIVELLLAMLSGSVFVNALRSCGKPCRIRLPAESDARRALVDAHIYSRSVSLIFLAEGFDPWTEHVDAVVLAAFCPRADGLCQFLVIDLDAGDHGSKGLADPVHAARVIAERADAAGLSSGLLVARSRRGRGRHVFLLFEEPVALLDAVFGVAALAASAWNVAASDVVDYEALHAFRRLDGAISQPGDAGAFELVPRCTARPPYGWATTLPAAAAFASQGGGIVVDPFTNQPCGVAQVPRCDIQAWSRFVTDARNEHAKRHTPIIRDRHGERAARQSCDHHPLDRIDFRTREFLEGRVPEGTRNNAAFAASANLLGVGVSESEALRLVTTGAIACGLPEREALATFRSALSAFHRKGDRR